MTPVRVLYLDHVVHLSGAEQSLFDLVVGLAGGPVEPVVVLPEDGPLATQLRAAGVLVRKVRMSKRLLETSRTTLKTRPFVAVLRLISFVAASVRLRRIVKEMRPQVIHTNTLKAHLLAVIPAKLSGVPLVWHVRDILGKGWLRRAFTFCARFPDRIVVPSRAVAQSFGRNKTVYRKLRLIPNGIRVDTFGDRDEGIALREELGAGPKDVCIGIVGRIAPWKGQDVFVHAAGMVADRHPKATFAVIGTPMFGDDEFQHELASLVYQYGLDGRVKFAGWRGAQEAMAALDVLVHASVEPEPFGRTIVEAMAAGIPVVAAAGGAISEILPPNAGFVVPPGSPEILADALENLLEDRRLRQDMGEAGKAVATRFFDVRRTVVAVGTLYGEISRESAKAALRRRRRGRLFGLLPARTAKATRRPAPRARIAGGMPPRARVAPDRMPPVLRPEAPDAIPAGRPQRRVRPAAEEPLRPVRRTARIDEAEDDDGGGFDTPPRRPQPSRPAPTPARRAVPAAAARDRRLSAPAPARRVHRPVEFEGGHVIRRPVVLDDPRYAESYPFEGEPVDAAVEDAPVRPVRRPVPPPALRHDEEPAHAEQAHEAPAVQDGTNEQSRTRPALLRLISGRRTRPRPEPEVPASTAATAPVLDPAPVPAPRPEPAVAPVPAPRREPAVVRPVAVEQPAPAAASHVTPIRFDVARKPFYEALKRAIDLIAAAVVLVAGAPLWLAVAVAIKLDSRGPVLFKGTVWGKDCRPFTYYKFRSMRVDGVDDGHRKFIEDYVKTGAGVSHGTKTVFKYVGDARITRVGRLIRKLSIDEIPQLVNVIAGDMSLVGPRPPLQYEYELYDDWAKQRLAVRPGMTGLQQTYARHSAAFTEKVEMDLAYIRDRSLWLDLTILLKTIPAAFKGE